MLTEYAILIILLLNSLSNKNYIINYTCEVNIIRKLTIQNLGGELCYYNPIFTACMFFLLLFCIIVFSASLCLFTASLCGLLLMLHFLLDCIITLANAAYVCFSVEKFHLNLNLFDFVVQCKSEILSHHCHLIC